MTLRRKAALYLLASYYFLTILFTVLTATLRQLRYNVHMRLAILRGRGGKDRR